MVRPEAAALSIEQFCHWANISRSLAYQQLKLGRLEKKKVGRRTIITVEAAQDWLRKLPADETTKAKGA